MKRLYILLAFLLMLTGCGNGITQSAYEELQNENSNLKQQLSEYQSQNDELKALIEEYQNNETQNATDDEDVFAARYMAAYSSFLKNPYSADIKKAWIYDEESSSGHNIYLTIEFTAENSMGADVVSVKGNTIPFPDITEGSIEAALNEPKTFEQVLYETSDYFCDEGTIAKEKGTQLHADIIQQLFEEYR